MKITSIRYSRLFNTGNFTNEQITVTADLQPEEDMESCLTHLARRVAELNRFLNALRDLDDRIQQAQLQISLIQGLIADGHADANAEPHLREWEAKAAYLKKRRATIFETLNRAGWEQAAQLILNEQREAEG